MTNLKGNSSMTSQIVPVALYHFNVWHSELATLVVNCRVFLRYRFINVYDSQQQGTPKKYNYGIQSLSTWQFLFGYLPGPGLFTFFHIIMVSPLKKSRVPKEPREHTREFNYYKSNYDLYLLLLCDFIVFSSKICELLCSEY